MGEIRVVMAREEIPRGPSVFLAGPSAEHGTPSWRPFAIDHLQRQWTDDETLIVLSPESRGGVRADRYEDQWDWENVARAQATVVLFWIPRDMKTLPGMTTNVEFGYDVACGRAGDNTLTEQDALDARMFSGQDVRDLARQVTSPSTRLDPAVVDAARRKREVVERYLTDRDLLPAALVDPNWRPTR